MNYHSFNLKCQIIANTVSEKFNLPHVTVKVVNFNHDKYYGEYFYENGTIAIYTMHKGVAVSVQSLLDTLLHELAHYIEIGKNSNYSHNKSYTSTFNCLHSFV